MQSPEFDIQRTARLLVQQYGNLAIVKAREIVEAKRKEGDENGADMWLRIIVAIGRRGTD